MVNVYWHTCTYTVHVLYNRLLGFSLSDMRRLSVISNHHNSINHRDTFLYILLPNSNYIQMFDVYFLLTYTLLFNEVICNAYVYTCTVNWYFLFSLSLSLCQSYLSLVITREGRDAHSLTVKVHLFQKEDQLV